VAGRIKQEDVEAVRERTDIVKVVSGHLQLRRSGADRLVGLCPFHPEKTPSFSVSPSKQAYYCFGCGEGGGVFRFLERVESLSFVEAVERLAAEAGITLRYEGETAADRRAAGRRQALYRAIGDAGRLYQRMLLEGSEAAAARAYLQERGIRPESVERFGIGYAPSYPDYLLRRLSKSYSVELLVAAGLVAQEPGGAGRDRFRGRVLFPIHDVSANPIGFGGRLLGGPKAPTGAPKYLNTPETSLYQKAKLLYNLHRAKADVIRAERAFLVEGYTDVIALDQLGIREVVATCGTALGEEHVRLLSLFAQRLVLAFDSDEAGAKAADRAFAFHERYPVDISVLVLPKGQDPADFALANGERSAELFEELVRDATPLVAFRIERLLAGRPLSAAEDQARAVKAALPVVGGLADPVLRERYAGFLADRVGVSVNAVLQELRAMGPGEARPGEGVRPGGSVRATAAGGARPSPSEKVEREALKLLVQAPELSAARLAEVTSEHFAKPLHRRLFERVRAGAGLGGAGSVPATANGAPPTEAGQGEGAGEQVERQMAALAVELPETVGPITEAYVAQVFLRLEEFALRRRSDGIRRRLEKLNPVKAGEEYEALYEQFVRLEGARRRVRAAAEAVGSSA
jgi:DNA primase